MGRPSELDGSFVIRLKQEELRAVEDPTAYVEELIRQCGHDPDTCKVFIKDSANTAHVLFTVTPNAVKP